MFVNELQQLIIVHYLHFSWLIAFFRITKEVYSDEITITLQWKFYVYKFSDLLISEEMSLQPFYRSQFFCIVG